MRKREEIKGGADREADRLASLNIEATYGEPILETLLDIRELLMKEIPVDITPGCICYDHMGKINPNCSLHNPVSEKDSKKVHEEWCRCEGPWTCQKHNGAYVFCDNPKCACHDPK